MERAYATEKVGELRDETIERRWRESENSAMTHYGEHNDEMIERQWRELMRCIESKSSETTRSRGDKENQRTQS